MAFDFTCLATRKANARSAISALVGARLVTTLSVMSSTTALSRDLHQQAAGDRFHRQAGRARVGQAAGEQQAQVLLGGDDGDRLRRSRPAR